MRDDFYKQVWEIVRLIPHGRVTSYGAIAKFLGTAKSSRMVGYALNTLKFDLQDIPAHRVVNRNGLLTGKIHFEGETMAEKLRSEGIKIENDAVLDFDSLFWSPENLLK